MDLFNELKRRNVIRVAVAYLIIGWLLAQVSTTLEAALILPAWFDTFIVTVMLIGFPIALIISWVYELTPEGIKKEKDIKSDKSITNETSKKLDYVTLAAAIVVAGIFAWQQFGVRTNENKADKGNNIEQNETIVPEQAEVLTTENLIPEINNKSIAVLPFTNMANNPESEPITVGLHDDLLTHISKISALKVISRTSVLRYKNTQKPIAEIAKELRVANILEGGVQRSGNQIRINVQLIDAATDEHIWAEIYDRELTINNIFKVQTEISTKIAAALKAQLTPEEQTSLARQDTNNLDAYEAYLAGRQLLLNRKSEELKQALKLFQKATELDPNYALAYVGQADALNLLNSYSDLPRKEMMAQVAPLITKALEINPLLAEAHTSKASFLALKQQYQAAEESYLYSISLNPNYATTYHWYGLLLTGSALNRPEEGLVILRKAALLDPLSPIIQLGVGMSLSNLGLRNQALLHYKKMSKLFPEYQGAPSLISGLFASEGDFVQSIYWQKKSISLASGNRYLYSVLAMGYLNIGDIAAAKSTLKEVENRFPNSATAKFTQGSIYLAEGNIEKWHQLNRQIYNEDSSYPIDYAFANYLNGNNQQSTSP